MSERTVERTNDDWLADLQGDELQRADAVEDLRQRLERGVYFYLSRERSDLSDRGEEALTQMAQDFVQDALLKILDNLDTFRGESRFTTWASKIATRVAISELRRMRYKDYSLEYLTAEGETMPDITSLSIAPPSGPQPERYTERQDVMQIVGMAIENALTERQRTALSAYVFDGVPIEEIAARMDTNRNALYKLLHDARLKLKNHLEEQGLSMDYVMTLFESA
ncbi:MAG: RNA polymerase sigma factor [Chloroflexi bacterium]|nr:RNA polymerase sigma factor [Chloroflexota bacterium]